MGDTYYMKPVRIVAEVCTVISLLGGLWAVESASAQGYLLGWGMNADFQASPVPTNVMADADSFAAGTFHSVAVKNGRVWAWGKNDHGQTTVPIAAQSDVIEVAAGEIFSLARKTDGSVLAWGASVITNVPGAAAAGVTQIAAGEWHALALKDGGVIAWGSNTHGQCNVPVELTNVTAVSAGRHYSLALQDGAVHVFGIAPGHSLEYGIRTVPPEASNDVVAISAGQWHALALKGNGDVVAWGGEAFFDATNYLPAEVSSDVGAISAGHLFSMALKTDGTLVVWGETLNGQLPVPNYATNAAQISAGYGHCLSLGPVMPPRFVGSTLPFGYVSNVYSGSVTAAADPGARYYPVGNWGWITVNEETGAIGGTPLAVGVYPITVMASNRYGQTSQAYSITVFATPPQPPYFVTTSPLPNGEVGAPYALQIVASNNPVFSVVQGVGSGLPPGLTLSTNGWLSGTPTDAYNSFFEVRATNTAGASNRIYNIVITQPTQPPVFYTESPLPGGLVGQPYSFQIVASNNPSFSLLAGNLPNGLTLSAAGLVSGTPTQIDSAVFTVQATNVVGSSNRVYALDIFGPPVWVTASPLPDAIWDEPYSLQLQATGNPLFSVASGSLPNGILLSAGGLLSGTPTVPGFYNFTVHATNAYGSSNRVYDVTVTQTPVFTTASPLLSGKVGDSYSQQIQATGNPTFSVVSGAVPNGLELAGDGWFTGTPTESGGFSFTVRATNVFGFADKAFDLDITDYQSPSFTLVRNTNGNVHLEWTNPNAGVDIEVWRSTNVVVDPVPWSNLGVRVSPWTNVSPPAPAYYQLRLAP